MKITTEEFIGSFHTLKGNTIGERRKSLFQLLNNTCRNEHSEVNFGALQPKTHLESVFKVDVMLYFQRISDLLDILKCENSILIEKVMKAKSWFWNAAFKNMTGQQFVDDVLGQISYNTKVQILNKLAMFLDNPEKGDEYYESVKSKYGLYLAAKLIPCCTKQFILSTIEIDNIKLTETKLLLIIKKHPDIIEYIFVALKHTGVAVSVEYPNVFKYVAHKNIKLYLKLQKEYKASVRIGWRITQKFVIANKQEIINNAQDYYRLFHSRQLVKSLTTEFNSFYINMFPKTIDDFSRHDFNSLLEIIKYLRHPDVKVVLNIFNKLYGQELWDVPELVSVEFIEMLSSDERDAKLQRNYRPRFISEDKWMCYYSTKIAIPYLKDRISLSSDINSRAELVGLLVETCKINKDKKALAQLCQFVLTKHRNDNIAVRSTFLRNIESSFSLETLEENHWTPINELIKIFTLNNESFYSTLNFLEKFILYRLKHNLPIKEHLIEYLKLNSSNFNLFTQHPEFEKLCLSEFLNVIPEVFKDKDLAPNYVKFMCAVISYNLRHKHDQISIFSNAKAIESVVTILQKKRTSYDASTIIFYCAHLKDNVKNCIEFLQFFLSKCESCNLDLLFYLIRKNPLMVQQNLEKIATLVLKQYSNTPYINFWKFCRNYEHLQIPQNIIKICLVRIKEDHGDTGRVYEKQLAVHALSCLMPSHEYLQIVALHYPRELRADATTQAGQKAYELQEYIASSLKYLLPPSEALESILMFCKGDYLKLIQSSLYSVCCNTNEDKLQPFFAELIGRAVSIRKHALHLTFHILDKAEIFSVLDKFMKNEKNPSIRKFIFKHSFDLFIKNRDDYSWELCKLNIAAVDINDQEACDILLQHNKIPRNYLDKYLTFTWEFLEKLPDPDNKIQLKKVTLLNSIKDDTIPLLDKFFCKSILEKYLFKFTDSEKTTRFQSAVQTFAIKYTIFGEPAYILSLFSSLKDYINTTWSVKDTEASGRLVVESFIKSFCSEFLINNSAYPHCQILEKFAKLWNEFLKPHEAFTEYLHIALTTIYLQKLQLGDTVTQIATLCDNLVNIYGIAVIGFISAKIDNHLNYFIEPYDQDGIYNFIYNLAENHLSLPCMLLTIRLLDVNKVGTKNRDKYEKIIQILKTRNEPLVQIFLHAHFTKSCEFY